MVWDRTPLHSSMHTTHICGVSASLCVQVLSEALGPAHRITRVLARLAADNMSSAMRREAEVRDALHGL